MVIIIVTCRIIANLLADCGIFIFINFVHFVQFWARIARRYTRWCWTRTCTCSATMPPASPTCDSLKSSTSKFENHPRTFETVRKPCQNICKTIPEPFETFETLRKPPQNLWNPQKTTPEPLKLFENHHRTFGTLRKPSQNLWNRSKTLPEHLKSSLSLLKPLENHPRTFEKPSSSKLLSRVHPCQSRVRSKSNDRVH